MMEDLQLKGYSPATQRAYLNAVCKVARHYRKSLKGFSPWPRKFSGNIGNKSDKSMAYSGFCDCEKSNTRAFVTVTASQIRMPNDEMRRKFEYPNSKLEMRNEKLDHPVPKLMSLMGEVFPLRCK